jgi:hypothetical protein
MTEMDSCITESNSCGGGRKHHSGLCFVILLLVISEGVYFRIFGCAGEVFDAFFESVHTPDIADGICSLICGSENRILRTGDTFVVWDCGP